MRYNESILLKLLNMFVVKYLILNTYRGLISDGSKSRRPNICLSLFYWNTKWVNKVSRKKKFLR